MLAATAAAVVVLDQISKAIAVATLSGGGVRVFPGFHFTLQRNPGAAFSLFTRFPWVFTILAFVISAVIVARAHAVRDRLHALSLGLVLGGALGNLTDRLVRSPAPFRGHVIDFIDFRVWPVFNVADAAVVSGAILLVLVSMRDERRARA